MFVLTNCHIRIPTIHSFIHLTVKYVNGIFTLKIGAEFKAEGRGAKGPHPGPPRFASHSTSHTNKNTNIERNVMNVKRWFVYMPHLHPLQLLLSSYFDGEMRIEMRLGTYTYYMGTYSWAISRRRIRNTDNWPRHYRMRSIYNDGAQLYNLMQQYMCIWYVNVCARIRSYSYLPSVLLRSARERHNNKWHHRTRNWFLLTIATIEIE